MARLLGCLVLLVSAAMLLPASAQDKKDAAKDKKPAAKADNAEKADKDKKPPAKDDDDDPKKGKKSEAKAKEPEEKLEYGQKISGRVKRIDANSQRDFTIEIPVLDKMKIVEMEVWKQQQLLSISQAAPQDRPQRVAQFQRELLQKQLNLYSPQDLDLRGADNIKVRSVYPPIVYDERGFLKKWTAKELAALKGNSKLPGYPADAEALKAGQVVQVYLAKTKTPPPKGKAKGGLKIEDDEEPRTRPEVVMIVITAEAPRQ